MQSNGCIALQYSLCFYCQSCPKSHEKSQVGPICELHAACGQYRLVVRLPGAQTDCTARCTAEPSAAARLPRPAVPMHLSHQATKSILATPPAHPCRAPCCGSGGTTTPRCCEPGKRARGSPSLSGRASSSRTQGSSAAPHINGLQVPRRDWPAKLPTDQQGVMNLTRRR